MEETEEGERKVKKDMEFRKKMENKETRKDRKR